MKYIMLSANGQMFPFIFPSAIDHDWFSKAIRSALYGKPIAGVSPLSESCVTSAGFIEGYISTHGKSETLNLESSPMDGVLMTFHDSTQGRLDIALLPSALKALRDDHEKGVAVAAQHDSRREVEELKKRVAFLDGEISVLLANVESLQSERDSLLIANDSLRAAIQGWKPVPLTAEISTQESLGDELILSHHFELFYKSFKANKSKGGAGKDYIRVPSGFDSSLYFSLIAPLSDEQVASKFKAWLLNKVKQGDGWQDWMAHFVFVHEVENEPGRVVIVGTGPDGIELVHSSVDADSFAKEFEQAAAEWSENDKAAAMAAEERQKLRRVRMTDSEFEKAAMEIVAKAKEEYSKLCRSYCEENKLKLQKGDKLSDGNMTITVESVKFRKERLSLDSLHFSPPIITYEGLLLKKDGTPYKRDPKRFIKHSDSPFIVKGE